MNFIKKVIFFALVIFMSFPATAKNIKIVTEDYPPYNLKKDRDIEGMSTDIVRAVLDHVGFDYQIELLPWKRSYNYVLKDENVLIYSIARIEARESLFKWVGKIAPRTVYFYKLADRTDIEINKMSDIAGYSIGSTSGSSEQQYFESKGFAVEVGATTEKQNIQKLHAGHIDLAPMAEATFVYLVKTLGLNISKFERTLKVDDLSDDLYMAFSQKTPDDVVDKVKDALRLIKQKGIYKAILRQHGIFDEKEPE